MNSHDRESRALITRLRAAWEDPFADDCDPRYLLKVAADEIERLRAEIRRKSAGFSPANVSRVGYTDEEAAEAWTFVNRFGPSNSWTATGGTAARMIGRLLIERERLIHEAHGKSKKEEDGCSQS